LIAIGQGDAGATSSRVSTQRRGQIEGATMSTTYQIRYGRRDGTLACFIVIARANDAAAVRLAHSLHGQSYVRVEVWRDDQCVHAARLKQAAELEFV